MVARARNRRARATVVRSTFGAATGPKEAAMGIDFDDLKNKAQDLVKEHGDKIEQGAEKAGEFAKQRFGHEDQVDKVVDKIQDAIPDRPANEA
jgi:hypothetical protein